MENKSNEEFGLFRRRDGRDDRQQPEKQKVKPEEQEHIFRRKVGGNRMDHHLYRYLTYEDLACGDFGHLVNLTSLTADCGVKKVILKEGVGQPVPQYAYVKIHFISLAEGNSGLLDSTKSDCESVPSYRLGDGEMILGFEVACKSMRVGEISKFLLHSAYAYGWIGIPMLGIPPDCRILVVIEMVDASSEPWEKPICEMDSNERAELPFDELYRYALELKGFGNEKFRRGKFHYAIEKYEKAIEILFEIFGLQHSENSLRGELLYILFSNIALCYLRVDEPAKALHACKCALMPGMPSPKDGKVYYRYAEAASSLKYLNEACTYIKLAVEMEPDVLELKLFQRRIEAQLRKQKEEEAKNVPAATTEGQ